MKEYVGLDTETIDGSCRVIGLSNGKFFKVKSLGDIFIFLETYSKSPKIYFLAYNADYDIQSMLKYFPSDVLRILLKGLEVVYKGISFQYIKGKFLRFNGNFIFDVFQYYQTSLAGASKSYLQHKKTEVDVTALTEKNIYSKAVIDHCIVDAKLCYELFELFYKSLPVELKNVKPLSNAFYSAVYFNKELKECKPLSMGNDYFRNAYAGGRFEIFKRGYFKRLYVYDINSAYPYEIKNLRSLSGAKYLTHAGYIKDATYSVYHIKVNLPKLPISPLLYKINNLCTYPVGDFDGFVTKGEYEAVAKYCPDIISGYHVFAGRGYPFRDKIDFLYSKKQTSKFPLPYKIVLNSLYGKTAQSIIKYVPSKEFAGSSEISDFVDDNGVTYIKFEDISRSNFIFASEITSRVRLRLYNAVMKNPDKILMISTDSIISAEPLDLNLSDKIGDWKVEVWEEAYLIGSGIYFYRKGPEWEGKFRGFKIPDSRVVDILNKILNSQRSKVSFSTLKRFSIQEANRLHDESLSNIIKTVTRNLDLNFDKKRIWAGRWKSGMSIKNNLITSEPVYNIILDKPKPLI